MATSAQGLGAAAALGAVTGLRSFAGAAGLALHGSPRPRWARIAILALAAGEAVGDKLPMTPARSDPPGLAGRIVAGGVVGGVAAGAPGAALGAACALASTFPSQRARAALGERTGLPDPAVAVGEDLLAYGGAWFASGLALRA